MRRIKIFIDITPLFPQTYTPGRKSLSSSCQQAVKQLKVVNKSCIRLQWRNENGRVINVTWQAKGWFNRLVTRHSPLLRRMLGQPDTYRFDDNIASPEFIQERAD